MDQSLGRATSVQHVGPLTKTHTGTHIANVGIRSHIGNHRVERLHNTMRERGKVMRHLKRAQSAEKILKGFRAYYNFVRPHMALENHTPTEMAAIPIQLGTNRWLDLIRQAARDRSSE